VKWHGSTIEWTDEMCNGADRCHGKVSSVNKLGKELMAGGLVIEWLSTNYSFRNSNLTLSCFHPIVIRYRFCLFDHKICSLLSYCVSVKIPRCIVSFLQNISNRAR
jgi:hypothetical protein